MYDSCLYNDMTTTHKNYYGVNSIENSRIISPTVQIILVGTLTERIGGTLLLKSVETPMTETFQWFPFFINETLFKEYKFESAFFISPARVPNFWALVYRVFSDPRTRIHQVDSGGDSKPEISYNYRLATLQLRRYCYQKLPIPPGSLDESSSPKLLIVLAGFLSIT